ncbi:MAG: septal ring lytic transglycosylase RlpA family protein [Candidatus Gastranaerophilales bacterium]|nr:septal ring lytic transglycosylase RlpA family protein [Candidatus Gastranaerophilales bacterium]
MIINKKFSSLLKCFLLVCLMTILSFDFNVMAEEAEPAMLEHSVPVKTVKYTPASKDRGHIIYIDNVQAIWIMKDLNGFSSEQRAKIAARKLNDFLASGQDPKVIRPVKNANATYLKAGDEIIITVDDVNAKAVGVSVHELAYSWANNTRKALGAPALKKDYQEMTRGYSSNVNSRYIGHTMVGMASWYGGQFHGRRASDGSRFNKEEYTAAHRIYPFGTLVKVTNLKNHKTCVVKITDRGPYAHGRIIDLSKKSAEDLGILKSGVGKVKLEVVGSY